MHVRRYEWVDVGMLDYDPSTKLYLVKRVTIVRDLQDCERETLSRQSQRSRTEDEAPKPRSGSSIAIPKKSGSSLSPRPGSHSSSRGGSLSCIPDAYGMEAGDANTTRLQKPSGTGARRSSARKPFSLKDIKMKDGGLESVGGTYNWVPRVRVMFVAEDPRVFASRVAHAHLSRSGKIHSPQNS